MITTIYLHNTTIPATIPLARVNAVYCTELLLLIYTKNIKILKKNQCDRAPLQQRPLCHAHRETSPLYLYVLCTMYCRLS